MGNALGSRSSPGQQLITAIKNGNKQKAAQLFGQQSAFKLDEAFVDYTDEVM